MFLFNVLIVCVFHSDLFQQNRTNEITNTEISQRAQIIIFLKLSLQFIEANSSL